MTKPVITVENLSKAYRIGLKEEIPDTLMDALSGWIKGPVRNWRRLRRLDVGSAESRERRAKKSAQRAKSKVRRVKNSPKLATLSSSTLRPHLGPQRRVVRGERGRGIGGRSMSRFGSLWTRFVTTKAARAALGYWKRTLENL